MASEKNFNSVFTDIATQIRNKKGYASSKKLKPYNMADEIAGITVGITPTGSVTYSANGTYDVTDKAQVIVNVPSDGIQGVSYTDSELVVDQSNLQANEISITNSNSSDVNITGDATTVYMAVSDGTVDISNCESSIEIVDSGTKSHNVTVNNLEPANIKSGVTILGIEGTLEEVDVTAILEGEY